jgi:glycosyltransferase involved in cell wall biosynthesis
MALVDTDRVNVERVPGGPLARVAQDVRRVTLRDRLLVPDAQRPWSRVAARHASRRKPDVIVSFGQPMSDHLAALRAASRTRVPWIAHFSDPWTDNPFRSSGPIARRWNHRLERAVVERADALVFTSAETSSLVMAKYPPAWRERAAVVPHAFDEGVFPRVGARNTTARTVRYLGSFYGARTPEPLLAALARIARSHPELMTDLTIEVVGPTDRDIDVGAAAEALGLPPTLVTARPRVSYLESLELMLTADLLLVIDAPGDVSVFLPSKLVDYLGAGRPLLGITPPGAAAALIRQAGGWVADPSSPDEVERALSSALQALRTGDAPKPPEWLRERYSVEAVAGEMADVIAHAVSARRAP